MLKIISIKLLMVVAICSTTLLSASHVLAASEYPSQIIDLTNWKQTLPTGSSKRPTEIKVDKLSTFASSPYFQLNSKKDGVQFRAPVNGVTTSGSGYPRSELREMTNSGKDLANWSTTSGAHVMYIDQAITAVPKKKKHVVAGQIHDSEDDVIVIRLEYPKLFVDINGEDGPVLDPNYKLGKRFNVKFVAEGGKIKIYYNRNISPAHTLSKKGSGYYFKAGSYTQSNCSKESDCSGNNYGEVVIYDLWVSHAKNLASIATPKEKIVKEEVLAITEESIIEKEEKIIEIVSTEPSGLETENTVEVQETTQILEEPNSKGEKKIITKIFLTIMHPFIEVFKGISNVGKWVGLNS